MLYVLRGYCTSYPQKAPKLACFMLYLKITNIFSKNIYRRWAGKTSYVLLASEHAFCKNT